jgi:hypothetical protein
MKTKKALKKVSKAGGRVLVDPAYLARLEAASKARAVSKPRARGRQPVADPRKPSHVPLNTEERAKLHGAAAALGIPYATWARGTLLVVADWPANVQPMRMGSACRGGGVLEGVSDRFSNATRLSNALSASPEKEGGEL